MKIGIRDGMLGLPLEETFSKAKEIGFDGVEICIGGNYREHPLWSKSGVAEIRALSEKIGIETPSLSPGGFTSYTFAHPNDETRAEGIAMLQHLSTVSPELGAKVILVPFFGNGKIEMEQITAARFIDGLKAAAETAEKYSVCLALESTLNADDHQQILDQVASPAVGVYYDMGNATGLGYDAAQEIRQLGDAIAQMHIKDTGGNHAGEGEVDFPAVIEATHAIGYDGWYVLETPSKDDPIAAAAKNLNFARENY
ncbi:MAG: sugar phosphate isomerase/epimerase [Candidatus Poribacteria bacterium]|nr:sugar phosphate isomerase/epimerase [Candidatus Poribacteria bacterium]